MDIIRIENERQLRNNLSFKSFTCSALYGLGMPKIFGV